MGRSIIWLLLFVHYERGKILPVLLLLYIRCTNQLEDIICLYIKALISESNREPI